MSHVAAPRMMIVLLGGAALVAAAVAALATGSWWILIAVVAVHAIASALVVGYSWTRAGAGGDQPDPVTEARIEEERAEGRPTPRRTADDREVFN